MKIAIHHSKNSFSERWIEYCQKQDIAFVLVNCYDSDIIRQIEDCDVLMWHFHHANPRDVLFAKQLLFSVKSAGKKVFPDFETCWHFDDKVGQKYLLEAIHAPLVRSFVFYDKSSAIDWIANTSFPKVFKLRGGAGSANVRLVKNSLEARKLVRKAFGKGFSQYNSWDNLKDRYRKYKMGKTDLFDVLKGIIRLFYTTEFARMSKREKGYAYFQEFIPANDSDIRIIVIDQKAFAIKRMTRENDFRASGSGTILYSQELFDIETVRLAFNVATKINSQCVAFDFIYLNKQPLIVEISYGFSVAGYDKCEGYWSNDLEWHAGDFNPQAWMVDCVLKESNE